jgi:hypothetical protein
VYGGRVECFKVASLAIPPFPHQAKELSCIHPAIRRKVDRTPHSTKETKCHEHTIE